MGRQYIDNKDGVDNQVNVAENKGNIYIKKNTRFAKRFEKLNNEVKAESRYEGFLDEFKYYLTKLDGVDMPTKLKDGGFSEPEIIKATRRKEHYWKKWEKHKFYESAQWIDTQIFAKITISFETHVEPLIKNKSSKAEILKSVLDNVIEWSNPLKTRHIVY